MQNVEDTQDLENAFMKVKYGTQQAGPQDCIKKYVGDTYKYKDLWLRRKVGT